MRLFDRDPLSAHQGVLRVVRRSGRIGIRRAPADDPAEYVASRAQEPLLPALLAELLHNVVDIPAGDEQPVAAPSPISSAPCVQGCGRT